MSLNPLKLKDINETGSHSDGDGLFLKISKAGTKSWIYRYQIAGRRRDKGLGSFPTVSLAKARMLRDKEKLKVRAGIDPLHQKALEAAKSKADDRQAKNKRQTFALCAEAYIESKRHEWKNKKHGQQWENTLKTYAYPTIGDLPVCDIQLDHILEILQPIWLTKTETATRVRNRVELVLDYATVLKFRSGENPARWRGNLDKLLASPIKIKIANGSGHHSALPYDKIQNFMEVLKAQPGLSALALQFAILTAARTNEVLKAEWSEIDLEKAMWVIPKERMKVGKEHRIALSSPAISLLKTLKMQGDSIHVFPGRKKNYPLSNMAMTSVLKRMDRQDITVHGFRSTFRDWVAETTNFQGRIAENALSHRLKDGAEAAYQRGDMLEKRREMMEVWANYCFGNSQNVKRN